MDNVQIATHVNDPTGFRLFKGNKNKDHAEIYRYFCRLSDECPLLKQRKCIHRAFLSRCVYGGMTVETGPTARAKSFRDFIDKGKEEAKRIPDVEGWTKSIVYIGEYVYLPYGNIDHSKGCWVKGKDEQFGHKQEPLPFVRNSSFGISGIPFMKRELFDPDMVARIADWHPEALFGGEIKSYQTDDVPRFLRDLRAYDRGLFDRAVEKYPWIADRVPGNKALLGRKAQIGHLPSGKVKHHSHTYEWDATTRTMTTTEDTIIMTPDPLKIVVYPNETLTVELCDPAMIEALPETFMPD